jgi:hypothetical protein
MAARYSASPRDRSHRDQTVVIVMGCTRSYLDKRKDESAHGCQVLSVPRDRSHSDLAVVMVMGCTRSYLDKRKDESAHGCQVLSFSQGPLTQRSGCGNGHGLHKILP